MAKSLKLDVHRLSRSELTYELRIRDLGDGSSSSVAEIKTILRNALRLEKTPFSIKRPSYPFVFSEDDAALIASKSEIETLIHNLTGDKNSEGYRKIKAKIAHSLNRANLSVATEDEQKKKKSSHVSDLLLLLSEAEGKVKSAKKADTSIFNLSVLQQSLQVPPNAQSSEPSSDNESDSDSSVCRDIKPCPVRNWGIKFSGTGSDSLNCFLERVEELRVARNLSKRRLFDEAIDLFEGRALAWFRVIRSTVRDYDSLITLLKEEFQPPHYDRQLFEEIKRRTQGSDESIGMFIAIMGNLFSRLNQTIPESTKLEILLENIDPYYQPHLAFVDIQSVSQLLDCCRKLDAKRRLMREFVPPKAGQSTLEPDLAYRASKCGSARPSGRVSAVSADVVTSSRCWNCDQVGHMASSCSADKVRHCYRCGKKGETVRSCPKCNKSSGNSPGRQ